MWNPFRSDSSKLPPPTEGACDFWAVVNVKLREPVYRNDAAACPTQGYYRGFGVRANPSKVHEILLRAVDDGEIDWSESELDPIDVSTLDGAMRKQVTPITGDGIWYRSGRVFYADPELEPTPN